MDNKDFRVNYILASEGVNQETLVSDFFDTAIENINWFREKTVSRETPFPSDDAYLKALEYTEKELEYGKESSEIVKEGNTIKFSFGIRNSRKDFEIVNEEGRRMWLRQHLDDHFLHYAIPAILEKSFNWKKDADEVTCQRFEKLHEAFEESLKGAYNLKTPTFWIDGE